ncbi:hypothetical protein IWQ60_004902 [Tieghemiomyces parasiticus]|uniref:Dihydrolipoamide acetyltransferase component of pyruvate dehydrogenase complex n=1 Tax=Tieghemiomyces parasiticus TaxID=78921 RepID=A0A9W8A7Z5_9FUNG|nr:hypothetical protein IWQ60_004902 [Tieghemiomyces parasiticus]
MQSGVQLLTSLSPFSTPFYRTRFVKPGDNIAQFDKICEVQSDKASVEITSRFDGKVTKLHHEAGDMALVGKPLVDIEVSGASSEATETEGHTQLTKGGTKAEQPAESSPPAHKVSPSQLTSPRDMTNDSPVKSANSDIMAIPAVRRLAKENGLDLSQIQGTGKGYRITKEDVLKYLTNRRKSSSAPAPSAPMNSELPARPTLGLVAKDREEPLTAIQKAMFKSMTGSLAVPHFGFTDDFDMEACMAQRHQLNAWLAKYEVTTEGGERLAKVSYMPFFIKALSVALLKYPILNAALITDESGEASRARIRYRTSHHIGVAMDSPQGLLVPSIKDVQQRSVLEIAGELQRLLQAGRQNRLTNADLQGSTITLSNVGMIGGTNLSPVLVAPTVCIGAIGKLQRVPRYAIVRDPSTGESREAVVPTHLLNVSWSADHRVIDGATMANFAVYWQKLLQNPALLMAQLR